MSIQKKILLLFTPLTILVLSCHTPTQRITSSGFELKGVIEGGGEGMYIALDRLTPDGIIHLDSTRIGKGGQFSFHTPGIIKGFYNLRITHDDFATMILDSGEKVSFKANSQSLGYTWTTTGSPESGKFKKLNSELMEYHAALDSLKSRAQVLASRMGGNKKRLDSLNSSLQAPFDSITTNHERYLKRFIDGNLTSFCSIAAIQQLSPDDFLPYYIKLDSALVATYPTSIYTRHFHDEVTTFRRTAIGALAPEITLPDTSGRKVLLTSLMGKTVLLYFWSSTSKSSLQELSQLKTLFNKFQKKNFTILAASFDRNKDSWLTFIRQYQMNFVNVCDTAGGKSVLFQLYNIRSLPYNLLISTDGKIVDKDIPVEELEGVLEKQLK